MTIMIRSARPEYRRHGISARWMNEILAREAGPLYTMVKEKRAPFYERFGFPKEYRIGKLVTSLCPFSKKIKFKSFR